VLPSTITPDDHDRLHDDPSRWREAVASIARRHFPGARVEPSPLGTSLVGFVNDDLVIKVYPPFLRSHWAYERRALAHLAGKLSLPTPELVREGDYEGWPYLIASRLEGSPFAEGWAEASESERCGLLEAIGGLIAEVHAIEVGPLVEASPIWTDFLAEQRARADARHRRTGLPAALLAELASYLDREVLTAAPRVILTGEYTPENLLVRRANGRTSLAGLFDFGDGLLGPADYDLLGPSCFLVSGDRNRLRALFAGFGAELPDEAIRGRLMRLLLLHRYANLRLQIAIEGWERCASLDALAALLWPE
jgi:hygromycin-B 7''-O-kinase